MEIVASEKTYFIPPKAQFFSEMIFEKIQSSPLIQYRVQYLL